MLDFALENLQILLVDDEQAELDAYSFLLRSMGATHVTTLQDSRRTLDLLRGLSAPIVFLDLVMPHRSGLDVLRDIRAEFPSVPVIVITANSDVESAVSCLKEGAQDYLLKPINEHTFSTALRHAVEVNALRNEVLTLKGISYSSRLSRPELFSRIATGSEQMIAQFRYIEMIAPSREPALILGETGTGKELFARAVHEASGVRGAFIAVDVSGLDTTLFSDTLFGHTKGAYTGAAAVRSGLIEQAEGGTIFLDEIGDLTEASQIKLLRLLQEGTYYPLGSDTPKRCKARIVAATNKRIDEPASLAEPFRRDLYYRLSTHLLRLPPLRERPGDIPLLAGIFVQEVADSFHKAAPQMSDAFLAVLTSHPFPGNVRELRTYLTDAVARCEGDTLLPEHLEGRFFPRVFTEASSMSLPETSGSLDTLFGHFPTLDELDTYAVAEALRLSENNQTKAARLLGISKQALSKRLKKPHQ